MSIVEVEFCQSKEERALPFWVRRLPVSWRESYVLRRRPVLWEQSEEGMICRLQTDREGYFSPAWRAAAKAALEEAKYRGAKIALSPLAADLPQEILPFARGGKLASLFAAESGAFWLKKKGKGLEEAIFVLADGGGEEIFAALETLSQKVNRLGVLTDRPDVFFLWQERMMAERGLVLETLSSCGQDTFRQADAVISWQKSGSAMTYALRQGAFFLDLGDNEALRRRLASVRPDVCCAGNLVFSCGGGKRESAAAEAAAFLESAAFARYFAKGEGAGEAKAWLEENGWSPVATAREKERKKPKNQGEIPCFHGENIDKNTYLSI
ncbi:hypothetical protein H9X85_09810 [Anaerotignum lactatifermentans]|uniref:Uncharacterized protein n=1 Tax=Anaerotignum lactatifermentans TaxID=160404 RepID=A0ABS2GBU0_9FIRM|nr:hypothetical protein [Anaerotignum lactatifermentans]MBM6830282.1 hypothetical protein [Anaerotignum lactatifermentans]MBM6878342.1 hypothetical protein [Anaerotignum lactatifermentans]MBM6951497.1 hypothetical protein [Anaerotignum lactatifermentans]